MRAAGIELTVALFGRSRRRRNELELPEQRTGRLQAEHLAAAGHRRLGYAFPDDERVAGFARPRLDGVRARCAELGLAEPASAPSRSTPRPRRRRARLARRGPAGHGGVRLQRRRRARRPRRDAPPRAHGPGDLAVIGVDDIPAAALAVPPLTTVALDAAALGRACRQGRRRHARRYAAPAPAGLRRGAGHRARVGVTAHAAPGGQRAERPAAPRGGSATPRTATATAAAAAPSAAAPRQHDRPRGPAPGARGGCAGPVGGGVRAGPLRRRGRCHRPARRTCACSTVATSVPPSRTATRGRRGSRAGRGGQGRRRAGASRGRCTRRSPRRCPARG